MDPDPDVLPDAPEDLKDYRLLSRPEPFTPWRALFWRLGDLRGRRVLDVGCGTGASSAILAAKGAAVTAIDVAPEAIAMARQRAQVNGQHDLEFRVASAYALPFEAEQFDVVVLCRVLHLLDLVPARDEVYRVLRPRGEAHFLEPVGRSRAARALRRALPARAAGDGRPLTDADLDAFAAPFASRELHFMGLAAARLDGLVPPRLRSALSVGYELDALVLKLPLTARLASMVVGRTVK